MFTFYLVTLQELFFLFSGGSFIFSFCVHKSFMIRNKLHGNDDIHSNLIEINHSFSDQPKEYWMKNEFLGIWRHSILDISSRNEQLYSPKIAAI